MKKLIVFALVAFALWQGWQRYPRLLERRPANEAIVQNGAGETVTRVRLTVDGQTFVREELAAGASATFPFRVRRDSRFAVSWEWRDRPGEPQWSGGFVAHGPLVARYRIQLERDGGVYFRAEPPIGRARASGPAS